jgi:hypothetical protein
MRESVFEQARSLSSGTLGSLSGQTRYDVIDCVQWDFMDFCSEFGDRYEAWPDAWNAYALTGRMDRAIADMEAAMDSDLEICRQNNHGHSKEF